MDEKPTKIQVMGFDLVANSWLYLGGILAVIVAYMTVNVLVVWFNEWGIWRFSGVHRLRRAHQKLEEMLTHAWQEFANADPALTALAINGTRKFPTELKYPYHSNFGGHAPEVVESWLKKAMNDERELMQSTGFFQIYPHEHWEREMKLVFDSEMELANLLHTTDYYADENIERRQAIDQKLDADLKVLGEPKFKIGDPKMHTLVCDYVLAMGKRLIAIQRWMWGRIFLTLALPLALSVSSLGYFSYKALETPPAKVQPAR